MPLRDKLPISMVLDFSVLAETEHWLAVDKPAPLLIHPTNDTEEPTLWHGLKELLRFELETGGQLSLINRLDRETSGITLVAKTAWGARALGIAMQNRLLHKEYQAIVLGHPPWQDITCNAPLRRQGEVTESRIWVKQCVHLEGKPSSTSFHVLSRFLHKNIPYSLILCRPHTGRMHQLRVHLAHLGHPILGDKIYSVDDQCYLDHMEQGWTTSLERALMLPRQALHASALKLPSLSTLIQIATPRAEREHLNFSENKEEILIHAPLPQDIELFLS